LKEFKIVYLNNLYVGYGLFYIINTLFSLVVLVLIVRGCSNRTASFNVIIFKLYNEQKSKPILIGLCNLREAGSWFIPYVLRFCSPRHNLNYQK